AITFSESKGGRLSGMPSTVRTSLGLVAAFLLLVPACSDSPKATASLDGGDAGATGKANGYECVGTMEGAAACAGLACLSLKANVQNKTAIGPQRCPTMPDCTAGGSCVSTSTLGSFCLVPCTTNAECVDGFVCVSAGAGVSFCLVEPVASG